jgi:hypothetical protein
MMIIAVIVPTLSIGKGEKFFNDLAAEFGKLMDRDLLCVRRASS